MAWKGDSDRYGPLLVALHWSSAALLLGLLVLGFSAAGAASPALRVSLLRFHVPLGVLASALTVVRIGWWFVDRRPDAPAGQPRWQTFTSHAVHTLLYLVVVLLGASGIGLMAQSGAARVLFFGASGLLPDFSAFKPMAVHGAGAFVLTGLACVHVGAALHHQFVRRDRLFSRMGVGSPRQGLR